MRIKRWGGIAAGLLLCVMAAEMALSARQESLSWDEEDHLFAGYMSLKAHDYGLNPEHPPLAKMVAALPLLPLKLKLAPMQGRYFKDEAYFGGREMLFRNGSYSADTLLFRARMAISVFMLALAVMVFFAGAEMFGVGAGLIAMALVVFEPSMLTNGKYVTTDAASACMFFATVYAFYRYVKAPGFARGAMVGVAAGLALAAKHSAIFLLPILIVLALGEVVMRWWAVRHIPREKKLVPGQALRLAGAMVGMIALAVFVLWGVYGFHYAMAPSGPMVHPLLANEANGLDPGVRALALAMARWHLLPESYIYGLVNVKLVANWMPSYIFGKIYAHGVWWYFPVVLAIKWTLGAMALLATALWAFATGKIKKPREAWFLLVPPMIYLAIAMASPLNIGVRHILPMFAFLLLFAAGGAWALMQRDARWKYVVAALLVFHAASSLRCFPNYMPYANEAWGGPSKTHNYLTDSATDWGQQLKWTKTYLDKRGIKDCYFAYFVAPFVLPSDYGIPCKLLPTLDTSGQMDLDVPSAIHGTVLVSYADLNGFEFRSKVLNPYQPLFERKPDNVIMNGIAVFNGYVELPLAASMAPTHRAQKALAAKQYDVARREAVEAILKDDDSYEAHMVMADTLREMGRKAEARKHYEHALRIVKTMEPSAEAYFMPRVMANLR
jgi:hypothetical protein